MTQQEQGDEKLNTEPFGRLRKTLIIIGFPNPD